MLKGYDYLSGCELVYEKLKEESVKIVFRDGHKITIIKGEVKDYDPQITTISIIPYNNNRPLFINAKDIIKIEVMKSHH